MATLKKIKKTQINLTSIIALCFLVSLLLFVYTNLFMKTKQVNLNVQVQNIETEITQLKTANESLNLDISRRSSYEAITKIAKESGLSSHNTNIVTIRGNR